MAPRQSIASLIKKLCAEKPDIAGCLCLAVVGWTGLGVYATRYDKHIDHQHRWQYTVIRKSDAKPECVEKGIYN